MKLVVYDKIWRNTDTLGHKLLSTESEWVVQAA